MASVTGSPAYDRIRRATIGRAMKRRKKSPIRLPRSSLLPLPPHSLPESSSQTQFDVVGGDNGCTRTMLEEAAREVMIESAEQHTTYWDTEEKNTAAASASRFEMDLLRGEEKKDTDTMESESGLLQVQHRVLPLPPKYNRNANGTIMFRRFLDNVLCGTGGSDLCPQMETLSSPPTTPFIHSSYEERGEEVTIAPARSTPQLLTYLPPEPCIARLVQRSPSALTHDVAILQLTSATRALNPGRSGENSGYEVLSPREAYGQHTGELARADSYLGYRSSATETGTSLAPSDLRSAVAEKTGTAVAEHTGTAAPVHTGTTCSCAAPQARGRTVPRPERWPQRPLLLRPTPGVGMMEVMGIRRAGESEYLNFGAGETAEGGAPVFCAKCGLLPINSGKEASGRELVFDFRSELFEGTAMVRILGATLPEGGEDGDVGDAEAPRQNYFEGVNRKFQAVIRGRFRSPYVPMADCVTGQVFSRPGGGATPKWILRTGVKLISFFAPHLEASFHPVPRFLSPLISTAQTVQQSEAVQGYEAGGADDDQPYRATVDIAKHDMEEPIEFQYSILSDLPGGVVPSQSPKSLDRARYRKKAFDKLYAASSKQKDVIPEQVLATEIIGCDAASCGLPEGLAPCEGEASGEIHPPPPPPGQGPYFHTDKEYTFEFLQHLVSFDDYTIDIGAPGLRSPLTELTNGQPLKMMAAVRGAAALGLNGDKVKGMSERSTVPEWSDLRFLWAFDYWHENLYSRHEKAEMAMETELKPKSKAWRSRASIP